MSVADTRELKQGLELGDLAAKTASCLRQLGQGRGCADLNVVQRALTFINEAKQGGVFLSRSVGQLHPDDLQRLSWATDTLIRKLGTEDPAYEVVVDHLTNIADILTDVLKSTRPSADQLKEAQSFFESLSKMLGSYVDQRMRGAVASHPRARLA